MSPEPQARLDGVEPLSLEASEEAGDVVDTMVEELALWQTPVEAGLFLVATALARGEAPVPADDRGPAERTLGRLGDAEGDLDHLAIVGVVDEETHEIEETLANRLPAWVEAGARLLGPRLEGTDAVEATAELAEITREIG